MAHAFQRLKNATEYAYERLLEDFNADFGSNLYNFGKQEEIEAYETQLLKIAQGDNSDVTREVFYAILRNNRNFAFERYSDENFQRTEKALIDEYESDRAEAMMDF